MKVQKHLQLLFILILVCINGFSQSMNQKDQHGIIKLLDEKIDTQSYFELNEFYKLNKNQLSQSHNYYYQAIIDNVFNRAESSNQAIDLYLNNPNNLSDLDKLNSLYQTKLLNHINLYEYQQAAETSETILSQFKQLNTAEYIETIENEIKIWNALKNTPKQQTIKQQDSNISLSKDKVGLFNIDVTINQQSNNFIFDTGANISVIKRSLAQKLGLKILNADFYVTAATGNKVKSSIAIAENLAIADILIKNVVFLVLEDKDFSFPQVDFFPNGAIGFPVIEAMDEIRITGDQNIFVPKTPTKYNYDNLALKGLMPIVNVKVNNKSYSFNFDTGAKKTALYPAFYHHNKELIQKQYSKQSLQSASAGGVVKFEGYVIDKMVFEIANTQAELNDLNLHIEDIGGKKSNFHGNLGQDYIKQFEQMIMSFKYSSLLFK